MSLTHTAPFGAALIGGVSLAVSAIIPEPTIWPIEVVSLTIDPAGIVTQYRIVRPESTFIHTPDDAATVYMTWAAAVFDVALDRAVPGCTGSGGYNYPVGQRSYAFELSDWVGSEACTYDGLDPGRYQLRVTYTGGSAQVSAQSDVFEVTR